MGLDILQDILQITVNVMSYTLHGVCPGPLVTWGVNGNKYGECEHIVLFHIYTCMKSHIHNGHPLRRHGNIEGRGYGSGGQKAFLLLHAFYVTWPNPYLLLLCYHASLMDDHYGCVISYMYSYGPLNN